MYRSLSETRSFLIASEPVCDGCGHGMGLHAEGADIECVACVERPDGSDCLRFTYFAGETRPSPLRSERRPALRWLMASGSARR